MFYFHPVRQRVESVFQHLIVVVEFGITDFNPVLTSLISVEIVDTVGGYCNFIPQVWMSFLNAIEVILPFLVHDEFFLVVFPLGRFIIGVLVDFQEGIVPTGLHPVIENTVLDIILEEGDIIFFETRKSLDINVGFNYFLHHLLLM